MSDGVDVRFAGVDIEAFQPPATQPDGAPCSEWDASWFYFPAPPREAFLLTLAFTLNSESTGEKRVLQLRDRQ